MSHICFFADDNMFYCKKSDEEIDHLVAILRKYSLATGQRINYQKSNVYFGKNIPEERRLQIKAKTNISQDGGSSIYLGLPESFGPSKVNTLFFIKDLVQSKVFGWQNKFLSPAGRKCCLKQLLWHNQTSQCLASYCPRLPISKLKQ